VYVCMCARVCVCIFVRVCVCVWMPVYVSVCVYVCMSGRKEEKAGEWRGESWWSGRILDCSAVLRKSSKADETSWNWHCPWEKSHISQEWVFLSIATPCTHLPAPPHSVVKQPLRSMTSVRSRHGFQSREAEVISQLWLFVRSTFFIAATLYVC